MSELEKYVGYRNEDKRHIPMKVPCNGSGFVSSKAHYKNAKLV
jgi:hypothetical protein